MEDFIVLTTEQWKKLNEDSRKLKQSMEKSMDTTKVNEELKTLDAIASAKYNEQYREPATSKDTWDDLAEMMRATNPDKCCIVFMKDGVLECFADNASTSTEDTRQMVLLSAATVLKM